MIDKNNRNVSVLEITAENYKVPAGEEHLYHVKMEVKSFDQHTGERLSKPFIQKFARVDFEGGMLSDLRQQGYSMDILHNPKDWAAKQAEERNKSAAQKAAEAEAKAQAEKEAMKEELRKEILAEEKAKAEAEAKAAEEKAKAEAEAKAKAEAEAKAKAEAEAKAKSENKADKKKDEKGAGAPAKAETTEEPDLS